MDLNFIVALVSFFALCLLFVRYFRNKRRLVARKKFYLSIAVFFILLLGYSLLMMYYDSFWRAVGNMLKLINLHWYEDFKSMQKQNRFEWFEREAQIKEVSLHAQSGWGYLSENEYNSMVDYVVEKMRIKNYDSVFEFGCGVGAVLLRIQNVYGKEISVGGSDFSLQQIKRAREIFPEAADEFFVRSMPQKHYEIPNDSKDHVISFGAFAMYLYEDEMKIALKEAIRIAKPGASLCFTNFVEPDGQFLGSILEPVKKSFWYEIASEYNLKHLLIEQMKHQIDRYFVCFSK